MSDRPGDRLGRWETLGAWLGFWTPPREAEVPPVPWRKIAVGATALVLVLGAVAAVVLPQVSENRQEARERQQRADAERRAAFLESVDREQHPRRGGGRPDPGRAAGSSRRVTVRDGLLVDAQAGIAADAARRGGKDIRGVECEPFPRRADRAVPSRDLSRPAAAYDCVAVTARLQGDSEGVIGMPFRLVVRFDEGRFAWCRIVPLGDRDRLAHPLPEECRLRAPS